MHAVLPEMTDTLQDHRSFPFGSVGQPPGVHDGEDGTVPGGLQDGGFAGFGPRGGSGPTDLPIQMHSFTSSDGRVTLAESPASIIRFAYCAMLAAMSVSHASSTGIGALAAV